MISRRSLLGWLTVAPLIPVAARATDAEWPWGEWPVRENHDLPPEYRRNLEDLERKMRPA